MNKRGHHEQVIMKPKTSKWAIWGLVLTATSPITGMFGSVPAIICGHKARSAIRKRGDQLKGFGMATWGLVIAYIVFASQVVVVWVMTHSSSNPPATIDLHAVHEVTADDLVRSGASMEEAGQKCLVPLIPEKTDIGIVMGVLRDGKTEIYSYGGPGYDGNTVFEIGSVSKVFTGFLLATMVRDGRVALTDPITDFLPENVRPPLPDKGDIQLVHLSSHSSGLPRMMANTSVAQGIIYGLTGRNNPYKDYDIDHLYDGVRKTRPRRKPGEAYEYSNFGAGLLGQLLANAEKTDYESMMLRHICNPMGMKSTVVRLTPELQKKLAPARKWSGTAVENWDMGALVGAGGIRSTANDLLIFLSHHVQPDSPEMEKVVSLVLTERCRVGEDSYIGLGWHSLNNEKDECWWHNGGTGGYSSFVGINRKKNVGIVILGNAGFAQELTLSGYKLLEVLSRTTEIAEDTKTQRATSETAPSAASEASDA